MPYELGESELIPMKLRRRYREMLELWYPDNGQQITKLQPIGHQAVVEDSARLQVERATLGTRLEVEEVADKFDFSKVGIHPGSDFP